MKENRKDPRALLRELIKEVVIAGEVETSDLYADYRPDDPKAYIGMILGMPSAGGGGDGGGGDDDGGEDIAASIPDASPEGDEEE